MLKARYAHSSVLLEDRKVLIAGGSCQAENFMGVAQGGACGPELFDPIKSTFSVADASSAAHNEEDAVSLASPPSPGRRVKFRCGVRKFTNYAKSTRTFGENSVLEGNVLETNRTLKARQSRGPNRQLTYFLVDPIQ